MERDVHQTVRGEGEEAETADKEHRVGTLSETQRCVLCIKIKPLLKL